MDLGQQSNLGSLVSAVLVGLLALASNQYAKMDRSALRDFLNGLQNRGQAVRVEETEEIRRQRSAADLEQEISRLETELSLIFERWKDGSLRLSNPRLKLMWKAIEGVQSTLTSQPELWDAIPSRSRVDFMWVLFWAAEMNPPQFSRPFLETSERIGHEETETVSAQAAVLQLYHGHDRGEPDEAMLASRLEEFARQDPHDMIGVFMYLIMARELYDNGHADLSERLLRRGIQFYSSYPGHVGSSKLINELMDQKSSKR